jgi:two-component system OmpR family sensor kinase
MNPLRSVGARLSLALFVVVAGALAVVYLVVVPSLENRLVNSKLSQLERSSLFLKRQLAAEPAVAQDRDFFVNAAATANARVVLYQPVSQGVLQPYQDSEGLKNSAEVQADTIALSASLGLEPPPRGKVDRRGRPFAEVAVEINDKGWVLLLSAPLDESFRDVSLVKRRLLFAGALVLGIVFIVGYGGSWIFARRIRKLERAADRIASGRFDEPVSDLGADEVGELARAFERMRLRLAQLDHARREFIANASHELRTPLFSLGGFLELMDDEQLDEATRIEFLASMREQVTRLTKLATELLDLSRLDAGHLEVGREAVSLAETARVVSGEFAAVALQFEHGLDVAAGEDAVVLADEGRVLQIARILVENALVHTPGGTSVRLVVRRDPRGASLAVEDDGPGIDAEEAADVFERFYRGDGSKAAGSGLGLAIARELAWLMGGLIELESSPGRTIFALILPEADAVPPASIRELETIRA